jgi:hypothetical protein
MRRNVQVGEAIFCRRVTPQIIVDKFSREDRLTSFLISSILDKQNWRDGFNV